MCSTLLYYSTIHFNHSTIEFISTLFSLLFLIIIISPALIILIDYDLVIIPSYIIYSLGLQWAWQFNIIFIALNDSNIDSYIDHYIISMQNVCYDNIIAYRSDTIKLKDNNEKHFILYHEKPYLWIWKAFSSVTKQRPYLILNNRAEIESLSDNQKRADRYLNDYPTIISRYLIEISQYILLPIYSFVRLFVYSFDVIHTLGIYSWGIKIDAIPGRINYAITLRLLNKGEYKGKCFELCGQSHLGMTIASLVY